MRHGSCSGSRAARVAVVAASLSACGYPATPITVELQMTTADTGEVVALSLDGVADPTASRFDPGLALSTRWAASRLGVHTVELVIDLDRGALPEVVAGDHPVALAPAELDVVLTERDERGDLLAQLRPEQTSVIVSRLAGQARELSAGDFALDLLGAGGALYTRISGSWRTRPAPGASLPPGDTGAQGDPPAGDPLPGDPLPGDPLPGDDAGPVSGDPAGDHESPYVSDPPTGCSCEGEGGEEELPEEPPEEEPDTGDADDESSDSGCDCQGDSIDDGDTTGDGEEPPPDDGSGDGSDDDSSDESSGCDCQGDDPEEPSPDEGTLFGAGPGATVAARRPLAAGVDERFTKGRAMKRPRLRCRRSASWVALEASPLLFAFLLSCHRRRPRGSR